LARVYAFDCKKTATAYGVRVQQLVKRSQSPEAPYLSHCGFVAKRATQYNVRDFIRWDYRSLKDLIEIVA
jgi:hypothetical protein